MIVGFHFIVCFLLILFQTTVLAGISVKAYDLLAPFVVYLAIYQSPRKAIPVLLFGGLMMDGLSGSTFGVYVTVYAWMYVGVRWAIQFLHVGNALLLPMLVTAGILFDCLLSSFCAVVLSSSTWPAETVFSVVAHQMIWGMLTGPLLVFVFIYGQKSVAQVRKRVVAPEDGSMEQ